MYIFLFVNRLDFLKNLKTSQEACFYYDMIFAFTSSIYKARTNHRVSEMLPNSKQQKQPFTGVLRKRYFENMQQIYSRTPLPNCHFNKVALQFY